MPRGRIPLAVPRNGSGTTTPTGELGELAEPLTKLAREVRETHLLMNNCYRDNAVRNAAKLRALLG